jgi:hypothetical protein
MLRFLLPIIGIAVLSGCAATTETTLYSNPQHDQYCFTKQTIKVVDGEEVSSETNLDCSDNQLDKVVMNRAGMADSCVYFRNKFLLGGKYVNKVGIRCKADNGDWHIVDDDIHN